MQATLKDGVARPVLPAYSDISLAIQDALHPPQSIDPPAAINTLKDNLKKAKEGKLFLMSTATADAQAAPVKKGTTDRARAERRTAWLLCAPAVIVMLLVTGYPILYAVILSLQKYDLRFPQDKSFVGLSKLRRRAHLEHLVTDVVQHGHHHGVLGEHRAGDRMLIALVMHRAIFGRGAVRTAVLIPYGIRDRGGGVRVGCTRSSRPVGFVPDLLGLSSDPFASRAGSFAVIILTEVWKTTPFMALLLLAGLALVPDELLEAAKVDGAFPPGSGSGASRSL